MREQNAGGAANRVFSPEAGFRDFTCGRTRIVRTRETFTFLVVKEDALWLPNG
jgi:hypothetical protein